MDNTRLRELTYAQTKSDKSESLSEKALKRSTHLFGCINRLGDMRFRMRAAKEQCFVLATGHVDSPLDQAPKVLGIALHIAS
jgi:hypothetical protein